LAESGGHPDPTPRGWLGVADRYAGGLAVDLGLYLLSAVYAGLTAATANLPPHGAWGRIAVFGYAAAALLVAIQLIVRWRRPAAWLAGTAARAWLTGLAWLATALVPLVIEAAQRAAGRGDRAQEEVIVVEHGGQRLLDTGTPYLSHAAIAALPADQRLLGYLPYQPGMALFGLPRAIAGDAWWTDARVWFALVTALSVGAALLLLRRGELPSRHGGRPGRHGAGRPGQYGAGRPGQYGAGRPGPRGAGRPALVRAAQAATVLPVCALTLAVGGDDLPVLGLCLLALAFVALRRFGAAGVAVGAAGALKLFAWPVAVVLLATVLTRGGRATGRYAAGAFGLPVLALVPAFVVDPGAAIENVVRFPLGLGLVESPAASPFPGHLIAASVPGGRVVAAALLVLAGLAIVAWLVRRPPADARSAALVCATGLLAGVLLLPATRFGYLLYPAAYAVWAPALRLKP
jgi:hypothetical protein